jgi:hypothetical protein
LIEASAQTSSKRTRPNATTASKAPQESAGASFDADSGQSEMRTLIERYTVDRGSLTRSFPVAISPTRAARFRQFYSEWLAQLQKLNFDSMSQEGKVDYLLLRNHLEYELRQMDIQSKQLAEIQPLVPFLKTIIDLEDARRRMEPSDSAKTAAHIR